MGVIYNISFLMQNKHSICIKIHFRSDTSIEKIVSSISSTSRFPSIPSNNARYMTSMFTIIKFTFNFRFSCKFSLYKFSSSRHFIKS